MTLTTGNSYHVDDTIVAIASAAGGAARGILRLSGPQVAAVLAAIFQPGGGESLASVGRPTRLSGNLLVDSPLAGTMRIPADLYFWPGPRSYTRQPLAELHTFGSPPLLAATLRVLCARGARLAEPGEFTLRAFLAGRLDLTQAEAVLGVIDAAGPRDLNVALAQLAGGLADPLRKLRDQLLDLLAHLEAGLDFVEEDIEFIAAAELRSQLAAASDVVAALAQRMSERTSAVDLPRIALVGSPNVGKSSLFNALTGTPAAIVANLPGTTRDFLQAVIQLDGCSCELIDTAGVDRAVALIDPLQRAAQGHAASQRERADLCLFCLDATRPANAWECEQLATLHSEVLAPTTLVIETKCDAAGVQNCTIPAYAAPNHISASPPGPWQQPALRTSAVTGVGLHELRMELRQRILALGRSDGGVVLPTAQRAAASLTAAGESLCRALEIHRQSGGEELVAAELRSALDELGKVVGAVYTDDILDRVFSRFCIGK